MTDYSGESGADYGRQRVERVPGSRRARLTPAPGADSSASVPADDGRDDDGPETSAEKASGPNDERMRQDVPPHY